MFDWIVGVIERTGYVGIALLMLLDNLFPPIPSELIMPLAGYTAARGDLDIVLVILSGTVGSILGALAWYYAGLWIGADRMRRFVAAYGRWLTLTPRDVHQAREFFQRHGHLAVFVGRVVPTIRTLISVPAGMAAMPLPSFLFWTSLGTTVWTALLAAAGYLLRSQYDTVADYLNPVSTAVFVLLFAWYVYRVVTFRAGEQES